jgi:hypothetical protein
MGLQIRKDWEGRFDHYLTEAIRLKQEGLENEKIFEFDKTCYVLTDLLQDGLSNSIVLKDMVKNAVQKATTVDRASFFMALNSLFAVTGNYESFYLVATANVKLATLTQRIFRIEDADLRVVNYQTADAAFQVSTLFREWQIITPAQQRPFLDYSYLVIEILANNAEEAFEKAYGSMEIFRGLLNFAYYQGRLSYTFYGGIPSPKTSSVLQPSRVIMLFDRNKGHLFDRFSIGVFDYSMNEFGTYFREINDSLVELIEETNSIRPCPLKERCLSCFRKYNDGLDGNVSGTAFLEFWKIFELVAMADKSDRGMAEDKVAKRIASLFSQELSRDIMKALCDKRNYIAHVGSLSMFDQDEINLVRQYCETAMMFLLHATQDFDDEESLEYFYENINANDKDLERLVAVILKIKAFRTRSF